MPLPQRSNSYHVQSPTAVAEVVGGGLSGFGDDEVYEPRRRVERSKSGEMQRAMQSLEYSDADLELLAGDSRQFAVLKKSLRSKGAITNEVLKQKLPLYIKYKKDRLAKTHPEVAEALRNMPQRTRSEGRMERVQRQSSSKPANRILTDDEKYEAEETVNPLASLGRILRPNARKATPKRAKSLGVQRTGTTPKRSQSSGSAASRSSFSSMPAFGQNSLSNIGLTISEGLSLS